MFVALVTFTITAAVTYSQDLLTPFGNAVAAGGAAVATGTLTYLLFPSAARRAAGVVMLLAISSLVVALSEMRDEAPRGTASFVGGCDPFTVHAQNRYDPVGTSVRTAPQRTAKKVGFFGANELITVDGWVRTQPAYPTNPPPFDSDAWFHLADDSGWVSFPGVRADPTEYDPTGHAADGGREVPLDKTCGGTYRL